LQDITGVPNKQPWTREEYDQVVDKLPASEFGVKHVCPFNTLQSFHCIGQFPLDALHDFLEKEAAFDGAAIILALVNEEKINIKDYNRELGGVELQSYESGDRPPPLKGSSKKLPGKALAIALHVRLMPYILWKLGLQAWMEDHKDLINLLLLLHRQNEYMQVPVM
jgi:hypothetical protein